MTLSHGHFIDQKWISGKGSNFASHNPATGDIVWQGRAAGYDEVHEAVAAARNALNAWSATPLEERIGYLQRFKEALKASADKHTESISKETGKPLWEAKTEVTGMISKVDVMVEAYHKRCGEHSLEYAGGMSITRHKPHGVIAILGPFNFPGHIPNGQIVPALLAGNTVIFKPSEYTPLVAENMILCWEKAGLPTGVLNMVQGGRDTGKLLSGDQDLDGLFFTGSWETGRILSEQYAKTPGKILALELGGNNPLIVTDVHDVKAAALIALQSAYITSGQRCSCAKRLIVVESAKSREFIDTLESLVKKIKVGPYTDSPEPFMGPVISQHSAEHILATQAMLKSKNGVSLVESHLLKLDTALVSPGLIDVTNVRYRPDEEVFGPLLQLIRVPDFDAALAEANNTSFGLTAGLLSSSKQEYEKFYQKIEAGIVAWNAPTTGASGASAPFGGIKRSGNNRPGGYYSVDFCAYPVATLEVPEIKMPNLLPGLSV